MDRRGRGYPDPDAGEELDLDEDTEGGASRPRAPAARAPVQPGYRQAAPAPSPPRRRPDGAYVEPESTMPVDEPLLDLDGTSADFDLAVPDRRGPGGTVYTGPEVPELPPVAGPVDARELDMGEPTDRPRLPTGTFDTTPWEPIPSAGPTAPETGELDFVEAVADVEVADVEELPQAPRPAGTFATTPWEPAPVGPGPSDTLPEVPTVQGGARELDFGDADGLPRATRPAGTFATTPWEPPPVEPAPVGPSGTQPEVPTVQGGARELDFGEPAEVPQAAPPAGTFATPWEPAPVGPPTQPEVPTVPGEALPPPGPQRAAQRATGPRMLDGGPDVGADLELAGPARPDGEGTLFDGPAAAAPGLDLSGAAGLQAPAPGSGEYTTESAEHAALTARQVAVVELFRQVEKAVKSLNLYEGRRESCERVVANAYRQLIDTMRSFGALRLRLTPYELLMEGHPVYTTDEERRGITYRLFRDGLRELEFMPHVAPEEFATLLEIFRAIQPKNSEADTVTQLWEQNLNGVRFQAVDFFLEGMIIGEADDLQARIDELVQGPGRSLHGEAPAATGVAGQVMAQLSEPLLRQAQEQRSGCLAALAGVDNDAEVSALQQELSQLVQDQWHRAMGIIVRLMGQGDAEGAVEMLVSIIDQLTTERRWQMLGASCRALSRMLAQGDQDPEMVRGLHTALAQLTAENKLMGLQNTLVDCTVAEFHQIAELFRILPREAEHQLVLLLCRMPPGEVQDLMSALLRERGIELSDFFAERLRGSNLVHVLGAIEELSRIGTPKAITGLRKAAGHNSPKVRLEAFRALKDHVDESLGPHLVSSLAMDSRDLRDVALTLLQHVPPQKELVSKLVEVAQGDDFDTWGNDHRDRLLGLMVRWGGTAANEFVVKTITALNPLRRRKVESLRLEMVRVLGQVGGRRSQQLLKACLDYRPPRAVRVLIEEALARVERGR